MPAACNTSKGLLLLVLYLACSPAGTDGGGEGRHGTQKVDVQDIHVHRSEERRPSVPSSSVPPATETTRETARQEARNETTFNSTKQPGILVIGIVSAVKMGFIMTKATPLSLSVCLFVCLFVFNTRLCEKNSFLIVTLSKLSAGAVLF